MNEWKNLITSTFSFFSRINRKWWSRRCKKLQELRTHSEVVVVTNEGTKSTIERSTDVEMLVDIEDHSV